MSEEVKFQPSSYRDLLWLFSRIFTPAPKIVVAWILLVLINALLEASALLVLRTTVNHLVDKRTLTLAFPWLIMLGIVFVVQQTILIVLPLLREQMRVKAGFSLQRQALAKIGKLPLEAFDNKHTYDLIYRVVTGADVRGTHLMADALGIIEYLPVLVTSAAVLGLISIWLPVTLVVGVLFMRFLGTHFGKRERRFEVENTDLKRLSDYYTQLLTSRESAAETRLWGIAQTLLQRWRKVLKAYMTGRLRVAFQNTYQGVVSTFLFTLVFALSLFVVSLSSGRIEAGLAALVLQALRNISAGMNSAQYTVTRFIQHMGYGKDFRCLIQIPSAKAATDHPVAYPSPLRKGIRLQGVTYRYHGSDTDALRNINLYLYPGEILAIVGENGAGKTTLAHILVGLRMPTGGRMTIDTVDAANMDPDDIRKACTFVFQHPIRYPSTLHENVNLGTDDNPNADLQATLLQIGLPPEYFPLETLLGPEFGGVDISGGEWQRVALARSLVRKEAELVVFDEPTAALDPLAELELFKHFTALVDGKTALLIAHRLGPTRLANRVAVLEKGALVEIGTPAELLKKNGKYAQMFNAQSQWYQ